MKKASYEVNGKIQEIEVSDEVFNTLSELETEDKRQEWRDKKHKQNLCSLEKIIESGFQIKDETANVEEILLNEEVSNQLKQALESLEPKEKQIIYKYFFENKKQVKIAEEMRISKQAVNQKIERILKKLKKFFI